MTAIAERAQRATPENVGGASRVRAAVASLTDGDVHRACHLLDEPTLIDLGRVTKLPRPALLNGSQVAVRLRRRFDAHGDSWAIRVAGKLACGAHHLIALHLGPDMADPSLEQLAAAVDGAFGDLGGALVGLVLAAAADSGYRAAPHCRSILDSDPRVGPRAPESVAAPQPVIAQPRDVADEEPADRDAIRTARLARKRARKERRRSTSMARPRYRRAHRSITDVSNTPSTADPAPPISARAMPTRRRVRSVMFDSQASYDDVLVGAVIWANIRFLGGRRGSKRRPCVVIAAAGRRHLIVRPCYSEGGMQTRRWKSNEIRDLESAGLGRRSWVAPEEFRVRRRESRTVSGHLAPADWNAL